MREKLFAAILAGAVAQAAQAQLAKPAEGPDLGQPVNQSDIAAWDISVGPDGATLPPGEGTVSAGKALYEQQCLACHGQDGAGRPNDQLAGGQGTLRDAAPVRTVGSYWPYATTLFDYIRRAMPFTQPQSLTAEQTYALTAYLLHLNGIIDERQAMNARTLPAVVMPNRDNFDWAYPSDAHAHPPRPAAR
jgi:cytochrome c